MCIICVSKPGIRQPDVNTLRTMFYRNPHGAGYMFARGGKVIIHKGFMNLADYLNAVQSEHFSAADSVIYHFRISTQAGVNPEMTHPFPLSNQLPRMRALDLTCRCGVAHNGIIRLTTDPANARYSDTALFIAEYLAGIIQQPRDLRNQDLLDHIYALAGSKFAIMDGSGYAATVGEFISDRGLLYSNRRFEAVRYA
ncbi:MAG: hypothetical protein RSA12_06215 [Clostridia bacterium]